MFNRKLAMMFGVVIAAGILTSCNNGSVASTTTIATPAMGSLITIVQDAPICDAISANITISGLTLTPTNGANDYPYIANTPSFAPSIRVNLQQLRDFNSILYVFNVFTGSYKQGNYALQLAQVATFEPTLTPPVKLLTTSLTANRPVVPFNPPLVVAQGVANVMLVDFDILRMLQVDSAGQITGSLTPVISNTQLTANDTNGFGELEDLWGFVRTVSTSNLTTNPNYTGSFLMQLFSPSTAGAPAVSVNLTANTRNIGFVDLPHLLPDSYVEVDALLDSQGNLVAKTVEFQALENPAPSNSSIKPSTSLIGPIVSITTDGAGNPTSFNLWVHDAEPDTPSDLVMDTIFQVNPVYGTTYQASALGPNFANLTFGAQNLAVGQEVVVHGAYTKPPTSSSTSPLTPVQLTTVEPSAVFLKYQSLQGNLGSMLKIGSDDLTGAFTLNPCCTLWKGAPIYVITNNQTRYVNASGLGSFSSQASMLIKGLPIFERNAMIVNGVSIPAGSMVLQAKQVHILQP